MPGEGSKQRRARKRVSRGREDRGGRGGAEEKRREGGGAASAGGEEKRIADRVGASSRASHEDCCTA